MDRVSKVNETTNELREKLEELRNASKTGCSWDDLVSICIMLTWRIEEEAKSETSRAYHRGCKEYGQYFLDKVRQAITSVAKREELTNNKKNSYKQSKDDITVGKIDYALEKIVGDREIPKASVIAAYLGLDATLVMEFLSTHKKYVLRECPTGRDTNDAVVVAVENFKE